MEIEASLLERKTAEIQQPANLPLEVVEQVFVLHKEYLSRQNVVPMVHKAHIIPVILADLPKAIGKLLTFGEELFEARETAIHRLAAGVDNLGVRKDE